MENGELQWNYPRIGPVPAGVAGGRVCERDGHPRHMAGVAGGLDRRDRAFRGVLSDHDPAHGGQRNDDVTFLTCVKTVHFRVKQVEWNEKTSKMNVDFLCTFT